MRQAGLVLVGTVILAVGGCGGPRPEGRSGSEAGPAGAGKLKLACRLANYGPREEAGYAHIHALGIKYVFINVPAAEDVEAVQAKLRQYELAPLVMRGSTDLSKPSSVEELAAQTAVCRRMGVKYMFISPKRNGADKSVVYERLRQAGDAARENGVTIVLETHPDLGTNADVHIETMRQINHPNVRVNFDTANIMYYNRGANSVAELEKVIGYVATVEVKDHNGEFETWNFPPLGKGVIDIPGILKVLEAHGYSGPVTMEIEGVKGVERSEDQIKEDIAESTRYLRSIGRFE